MISTDELEKELNYFIGSEHAYTWSILFPTFLLSDGAKFLADNAGEQGAYWLMDVIASWNKRSAKVRQEDFQTWYMTVQGDRSALIVAQDRYGNHIARQAIPWTDFNLPGIKLYVSRTDDELLIYLPTED